MGPDYYNERKKGRNAARGAKLAILLYEQKTWVIDLVLVDPF